MTTTGTFVNRSGRSVVFSRLHLLRMFTSVCNQCLMSLHASRFPDSRSYKIVSDEFIHRSLPNPTSLSICCMLLQSGVQSLSASIWSVLILRAWLKYDYKPRKDRDKTKSECFGFRWKATVNRYGQQKQIIGEDRNLRRNLILARNILLRTTNGSFFHWMWLLNGNLYSHDHTASGSFTVRLLIF